uniref:Ribosomal protein S11 n=1 Tax=Tetraselmis sp. CCMP 881 TaxID=1812852 RepID=A0A650AR80_9CHLO|nr:ribosomal protein S11 [Tetraselmis sp. CCMP 881]
MNINQNQLISKPKISRKKFKRDKTQKLTNLKANGFIYIQGNKTNTIITLTDLEGNTKNWASSGSCGYKGARRKNQYAAKAVAEKVAKKALTIGYKYIILYIRGTSQSNQKSAVKGLAYSGLKILRIKNTTNLPHNGCRASKKRRK